MPGFLLRIVGPVSFHGVPVHPLRGGIKIRHRRRHRIVVTMPVLAAHKHGCQPPAADMGDMRGDIVDAQADAAVAGGVAPGAVCAKGVVHGMLE